MPELPWNPCIVWPKNTDRGRPDTHLMSISASLRDSGRYSSIARDICIVDAEQGLSFWPISGGMAEFEKDSYFYLIWAEYGPPI